MRVLLTVNPAPGHLFALVPLAWALHLDGHQVLVAAPQSLAQQVPFPVTFVVSMVGFL